MRPYCLLGILAVALVAVLPMEAQPPQSMQLVITNEAHDELLKSIDAAIAQRSGNALTSLRVKIEMMPPRTPDKYSMPAQRDEKLHLLLEMLHRVDAAQDKAFDPAKDSPQLNVTPPVGPGGPFYNSGVSPDAISDPVVRTEYLRRIAENKQKIARWNREISMRRERASLVSVVVEYAKRFELTSADKNVLQQAIDMHLTEPKLNAEVKERIGRKKK